MSDHPGGRDMQEQERSPGLRISNEIVGLLSRYTGRGPTQARTTVTSSAVLVTLGDTLTRGELSLVAAGQHEAVTGMRRIFHELMREEACGAIETILGRRTVACLADIDPRANIGALVFILAD